MKDLAHRYYQIYIVNYSTYLDKLSMDGISFSPGFLSTLAVLHRAEHSHQYNLRTSLKSQFVINHIITYAFMYILSDADKSVGQSTGAALLLWL